MIGTMFAALYVGHMVGDHWGQTDHQAAHKGEAGWSGRLACGRHVLALTIVKMVALMALVIAGGLHLDLRRVAAALTVDAVSHWWIDRRTTLALLVGYMPWLTRFYRLGRPRPGRDDNPTIGTGAYALDQSWHIGWLFVAALICSL